MFGIPLRNLQERLPSTLQTRMGGDSFMSSSKIGRANTFGYVVRIHSSMKGAKTTLFHVRCWEAI